MRVFMTVIGHVMIEASNLVKAPADAAMDAGIFSCIGLAAEEEKVEVRPDVFCKVDMIGPNMAK